MFYLIRNNGVRPPGIKIMKVEYIVIMLKVTVISNINGGSRGQNGNYGGRKGKAYSVSNL
jgi:hypothetical protein